ncbi:MAG: hypothetical protein U1E40_16550 [Amaricoccus sp.]
MTMTIHAEGLRPVPRFAFPDLHGAWAAHRRRRAQLTAIRQAAHLGPRLLEDMGIDPAVARAAVDPWEHLRLNGLFLPRR